MPQNLQSGCLETFLDLIKSFIRKFKCLETNFSVCKVHDGYCNDGGRFLSILILKAGLKPLFHAFKGFLAFQRVYVILTEKAPPHIIRGSLMCNRM